MTRKIAASAIMVVSILILSEAGAEMIRTGRFNVFIVIFVFGIIGIVTSLYYFNKK